MDPQVWRGKSHYGHTNGTSSIYNTIGSEYSMASTRTIYVVCHIGYHGSMHMAIPTPKELCLWRSHDVITAVAPLVRTMVLEYHTGYGTRVRTMVPLWYCHTRVRTYAYCTRERGH